MKRRVLLGGVLALAGCGLTAAQWQADVQTIEDALPSVLTALQGLGVAIPAAVTAGIATAEKDAAALLAAMPSLVPVSSVQTFVHDVQALAPLLALVPGVPGNIVAIVDAAISLLPAIAAAFGIAGAATVAPKYDPVSARLILKAAR